MKFKKVLNFPNYFETPLFTTLAVNLCIKKEKQISQLETFLILKGDTSRKHLQQNSTKIVHWILVYEIVKRLERFNQTFFRSEMQILFSITIAVKLKPL